MNTPLTDQQIDDIEAIATRATDDPFYLSDCEGSLQVWHERALVRVTRDSEGEISSYAFPFAFPPAERIIELDLDSWDPGEDTTDDKRRQDITDLVDARAALPALLAEVRRLRAELDRRAEDLAFLERTTLPELCREAEHHKDGKQRWRGRAEKAEAELAGFRAKTLTEAADKLDRIGHAAAAWILRDDAAPAAESGSGR